MKKLSTRNIVSILKFMEEWAMSLVLMLIFILVPLQVFVRYLFQLGGIMDRLVEFTGICLVWVVAIGMVRLLHDDAHLRVPFLEEKLAARAKRILQVVSSLAVSAALGILLWSSVRTAQQLADMKTPMLGWTYLVYYGVLLSFAAIGTMMSLIMLIRRMLPTK